MLERPDNPYSSPNTASERAESRGHSLTRGFAIAIPAAAVGFAIPFVLLSAAAIARHYVLGRPFGDMQYDLRILPLKVHRNSYGAALAGLAVAGTV